MINLLKEYKTTLFDTEIQLKSKQRKIHLYKKKLLSMPEQEYLLLLQHDEKILNAEIRSLKFIIEYLETGRQPGARRGIERRSAYQKEIISERNTIRFISYDKYSYDESHENEIDSYKSQMAKEIVQGLTERQKEILELHAQKFSCDEIGTLLGITKQTVWETIETCKNKIENEGWVLL